MMETLTRTPLEDFVRDYAETVGGAWDEVEPQVYDLLLPVPPPSSLSLREKAWREGDAAQSVLRVAFDPEAIPEHPGSQLVSYGTPLVDRLLESAVERGRFAELYYLGLNLTPHDLVGRVRKSVAIADGGLHIERVRAMHFAQALFWFQAAFVSDQKEQDILLSSLDLHYGRQARHREKLLDHARLAEQPAQALPEAPRVSLAAAYPLARAETLRTLTTLANARQRELRERLERQVLRMKGYYADLRAELEAPGRTKDSDEARARRADRLQAIAHEERLRIAELHQKNLLRVHMRLMQTLVIHQPKLLVHATIAVSKRGSAALEMVWDPLLDTVEAIPCPMCDRPGFAFTLNRQGQVLCTTCAATRNH